MRSHDHYSLAWGQPSPPQSVSKAAFFIFPLSSDFWLNTQNLPCTASLFLRARLHYKHRLNLYPLPITWSNPSQVFSHSFPSPAPPCLFMKPHIVLAPHSLSLFSLLPVWAGPDSPWTIPDWSTSLSRLPLYLPMASAGCVHSWQIQGYFYLFDY